MGQLGSNWQQSVGYICTKNILTNNVESLLDSLFLWISISRSFHLLLNGSTFSFIIVAVVFILEVITDLLSLGRVESICQIGIVIAIFSWSVNKLRTRGSWIVIVLVIS